MTTAEMKEAIFRKLQDEESGLTKSDIRIKRSGTKTTVTIKGYEEIPFTITEEKDEYFGFVLWVKHWGEYIAMIDSKRGFQYGEAMVAIGYTVATTF